jgi:hypothetical protein
LSQQPTFFEKLLSTTEFNDFANRETYVEAPNDWFVAITDVIGSTLAIQEGRYKDVNAVGVASIVCIRNAVSDVEIPFVFGGDGAMALIPGDRKDVVRRALGGMKALSKEAFGLSLRAGLVPIRDLNAAGHEILVGRHAISEHAFQAFLAGDGVKYAESWIKDSEIGKQYDVGSQGRSADVDCSGFECRWEPVASTKGVIVSLIVEATGTTMAERNASYQSVIAEMGTVTGGVEQASPVHRAALTLSKNPQNYRQEICLRTNMLSTWRRVLYGAYAWVETIVGTLCLAFGVTIAGFGERYVNEIVVNTDFRKFDDALRMVIDVESRQFEQILVALEAFRQNDEIVYGVHTAAAALMTCAVSNRHGQHIHFVDGADGGYALAARQLKTQKAMLKTVRQELGTVVGTKLV